MMITERSKSVIPFRPGDAARVGEGCFYLDLIVWLNGDRVELGDRVGFNYGCYVNGYGGLSIGDRSIFGPYTMIHTANHEMDLASPIPDQGWKPGRVTIGADCWIGMGVSILPGITIGEGCVVGAGSVVVKDMPPFSVAVGNPARALRDRREQAGVRVLFLQRQPCIRALKYAAALRAAEPGIQLGFAYQGRTLTGWYGSGDELFAGWWRLPATDPAPALDRVIREFRPALVHSHNLPDGLTLAALEVAGDRVPVIHDSHDLQSLRRTPYEDGFDAPPDPPTAERDAIEGCAALIVVSEEMLEAIRERHRPRGPVLVFANYALGRDVSPGRPRAAGDAGNPRLVYQGSLSANGSHYDLRDGFAAAGLPIDVYPNRDAPAYRELAARAPGLRLMDRLAPADLMRRLPGYDLGWAVFNPELNAAHLDTALPNKAFEYLASGLPILAGPHRALRRLVAGEGLGLVVERAGDVAAAVAEADLGALRARVAENPARFTVEARIGALLDLYRQVTAGALAA